MRRAPVNGSWETRPNANFFAEMVGAAAPWQPVRLPHDAALGRERDAAHGAGSGYVPGGVDEYRTTLTAPEEYLDRRVLLEFEGVYRSAMVYVNGALAGQWATGYTGFTVDLDDHLLFGADNGIRVVCRAHKDSRWYSGAGIHRTVHLVVGPRGALLDMGVYPLSFAHLVMGVPNGVEATGEIRDDGLDLTASVFLRYGDGRFAHALTSMAGPVDPVASVGGSRGAISLDAPFFFRGSYRVLALPELTTRSETAPIEGRGYVPMFRAVGEGIADGLLEHPLRPLADTIAVLDMMDEVRRQLAATTEATS